MTVSSMTTPARAGIGAVAVQAIAEQTVDDAALAPRLHIQALHAGHRERRFCAFLCISSPSIIDMRISMWMERGCQQNGILANG